MRDAHAAVLLWLLTAGCARVKPDTVGPEPQAVQTQPGAPQPAAKRAAPATAQPKPSAAPAPKAKTAAPPAASAVASPGAKTSAAAPALDSTALTEELKATKAIGFFTKITLKNQIDDLLDSSASTTKAGRSSP